MKKTYLLTYLLTLIFISSCTEPHLLSEPLSETSEINPDVVLKDGILNISSKDAFLSLYEEVKLQGAESFYQEKIKNLQKTGFKPLRPFFTESENTQLELFLVNKKNKQDKINSYLSKSKTAYNCYNSAEVELDDRIIIDNNFAILLNEDREIVVEKTLYKYQENGLYLIPEVQINDFRDYELNNFSLKTAKKSQNFEFQEMDYRIEYNGGCSSGTVNTPTIKEPDFYTAKLNFETFEFSKNHSLWGENFGYARTQIISVPNDKRAKLKFWNRNYVLYKSFGTEIRFQKRVSFLGIKGWQKSYPTEIAMGINSIEYNYEIDSNTFINSKMIFPKIYSFRGYDYFSNGQISYTKAPSIYFPLAKTLGALNGLKVTINNPFTDFKYKINISPEDYANLINKASDVLLKEGGKQFPKLLGYKGDEDNTLLFTNFYRNNTSISIHNKNWRKKNENNITKTLEYEVPTITITANIADQGEPYFSKIKPMPTFDEKAFKTGAIDFFGGVLYNNKWYGARMVSTNFKR